MARVALVVHGARARAVEMARDVIHWLSERGHEVRLPAADAETSGLTEWSFPDEELAKVDLAVSLGGDGTMLRAVDLVSRAGVPVLGVNLGHLGYLTECEPAGWREALDRFFADDYEIEERMTLDVAAETPTRGEVVAPVTAFNEAWLEKTQPGHTVRMAVSIGGSPFTTYAADGLIVATATGSTAYNLSVGGPILSPTLLAMVMTPVSPHQLFDCSLVLDPSEAVRIEVLDARTATLLVDGRRICELGGGDAVTCRGGAYPARLVTFGARDFHRILKTKFGLADR